jgi:hypothetical protein
VSARVHKVMHFCSQFKRCIGRCVGHPRCAPGTRAQSSSRCAS